ncbi:hypothetical protein PVK06_039345 [Gossypium arboreum]|uniref:RNase H type-1 domain-containing protein n=1 Tax=Gossypium arboreum TaxID=29729 RepID=A0ABR0N2L6_GOSAR|nr:hypothetical protein PVK06_039345 [Gossypium arboreum]
MGWLISCVGALKVVAGDNLFWKSHVSTPLVVEAWASLEAIQFVKEMGFRTVEFEDDSLLVITKMKSTITDRFGISMLISEAKLLVTEFTTFHFQHICCLGNRDYHLMAKEGFHRQCDSWWVEDSPVTIHSVVHTELLHVGRVVSPQSR